jgi:uncharacterized protein YjiS (DUF1127 family)
VPPLVRSVGAGGIALPREANWRRKMITMSQAAARPAMSLNSAGFFRRFGTRFVVWACVLVDHLDRRAAIQMLHQMDDRELRDIGLTRSHIEDAVCGVTDPALGRLW